MSKAEFVANLMRQYPSPPTYEQYEAVVQAVMEKYRCTRTYATSQIGKVRERRSDLSGWMVGKGARMGMKPKLHKLPEKQKHPSGLSGFRQLYDKSLIVPQKIKNKISTYLKEKGWEHDEQFRQVCGVRQVDWRKYRDEFSHLQVRVDGRLIWGHPDIIDEMREVVLR